ncbi:hypothetical protein CsSME_00022233 [Camellia sinensis var. sinensis]
MFNVFNEVADLATSCDNKCDKVVEQLRELKGELKEELNVVSGSNNIWFYEYSECFKLIWGWCLKFKGEHNHT